MARKKNKAQIKMYQNVTMDVFDAESGRHLRRSKHKNRVVDTGLNIIRDLLFGAQDPLEIVFSGQATTTFVDLNYNEDLVDTFDHLVRAGTTTLVLNVHTWMDANPLGKVVGITCGGQALTKAVQHNNVNMNTEIWYLDAPPLGHQDITITLDGFTDGRKYAATNLYGTQNPSLDQVSFNAGFSTAGSVVATPVSAYSIIMDAITTFSGSNAVADASQTRIYHDHQVNPDGGAINVAGSYYISSAATPKTMSWSWTDEGDFSLCVANFKLDTSVSNSIGVTKGAVGTEADTVVAGDDQLVNEVYRSEIISHTKANKELEVVFFVAADKANGFTLQEVGLLTDSNVLYARIVLDTPIEKTSSIVITFTWTLSFEAA